jgi:hypothetical protein
VALRTAGGPSYGSGRAVRPDEDDAALGVCGQWARAEPGFRRKARAEVESGYEEWLAGLDAWVEAALRPLGLTVARYVVLYTLAGQAASPPPRWPGPAW